MELKTKRPGRWGKIAVMHGKSKTPEYMAWADMIRRIDHKHHKYYQYYGGRGIKVCAQWRSFVQFYADMGDRPGKEFSLDRINNDGDYEPGNCRWATRLQQASNTRSTIKITINGETKSLKQWAKHFGVNYQTAKWRHRKGWSVTDTFRRRG